MTGKHSGVVKHILERAPNAMWNHCFLHREALAAKDMVPELDEALKDVIKVVNHIKRVQKTAAASRSCVKTWVLRVLASVVSLRGPLAIAGKVLSGFF